MTNKSIQKNLRFSPSVVMVIEKDAAKLGYNFNKYVEFIVNKKAEELMNNPVLDAETIKQILESEDLSNKGKLPRASTEDEITNHINSVIED